MRALRIRDSRVRQRASGRRIVQWPVLLALPVMAGLSTTDARAFVSMAFEGPFATICVALITGFVLLVAGLRGQLHRD